MLQHRALSAAGAVRGASIIAPVVARTCLPSKSVVQRPACSRADEGEQRQRRRVVALAKKQKGGGGEPASSSSSASSSGSGNENLDKVAREVEGDAEERMKKAIAVVNDNFNTMRTGRANPAILDKIMVDYYGVPTPLKSMASVSVPDASTLIVSPFDRGALRDVEKGILESDIGINPNNDGEKIRLNIPPMTQDRRKELSKKVSKMGEDGKVAVRNVRKDALKRLDKHEFSKDARKALEDSIQKVTDRYVKAVDDAIKSKTEELMKV
ncbi:MAG: ribosome recycling factor domain-containing protein [Monoraphidium minutum]|nr:MAG: ribosome recycling factor domain-containing protein [Monoraphidium minutum]